MNPIIAQVTLEEDIEKYADEIAEKIYKKFDEFHKPEIKMTRYQSAMLFCKMLKASLYMKLVDTKIKCEETEIDVVDDEEELDEECENQENNTDKIAA